MKSIFIMLTAIFAVIMSTFSMTAHAEAPLPIDYWAIRDSVSSVSMSPDGKHVLILKIESKEGEHIMEIYDTSDFSKKLRRLNADPMEIISAQWVSDNHIFGTAWKVVRKSVSRPEEDVRSYATYSYNLAKNKFSQIDGNFNIISRLPKEPMKLLIAKGTSVGDGLGVDPFAAFRPRSFYKFDLNRGSKQLVLKGNEKYGNISFDIDGNPRFANGFDQGSQEQIFYARGVGESKWDEIARYDLDEYENLYRVLGGFQGFAGTSAEDPNIGYVIDNRGTSDKAALWEFDFNTKTFGKKLYENPDADVLNVQFNTHYWGGKNNLAAAVYSGAKRERHWFDMEEKALHEQFEQKIPNAHQVSITSRSRDGQSLIVSNSGPKDPGSYWIVQDGKMAKLASRNPLLKPEDLSNVEYIRYPARDGQIVPAYVTKPKGPGPHPLVVLPHGGPHVNEVIGYDEWGQILANNGYMVLQPQYRMSVGWGQKHFDSAFGQHGLAMQDDKDDGAKYLISKGWADKDRVAMFGWSYGGYAALVATSRSPNIYQCAIAGAAVADAKKVYLKRSSGSDPKALDAWSRARGGYVGINPIDEVSKVNIPLLMVHGDWDARVLYFNMKDYKKAMKSAGKTNAEYLTLKGADHFSRTLMYNHQRDFYTKMLDYLENDCGPGGL